ncbi:hypothetical protein I4U23_030207 [Adineta vaga]|nr:hypothetical protein I4U23_030207 [Adineta vaga]
MNASVSTAVTQSNEQLDTRFFSQRAKHISLLNEQMKPVPIKPSPSPSPLSSSEVRFQFSNRTYVPITETPSPSMGKGHGNSLLNESRQNVSVGRGRTTVPLSSFVLQKDNLSSTTTAATVNTISSPIFVMHDEVQFVRPYFGPRDNHNTQPSTITSQKRAVLLSALKEIESGLKTL